MVSVNERFQCIHILLVQLLVRIHYGGIHGYLYWTVPCMLDTIEEDKTYQCV